MSLKILSFFVLLLSLPILAEVEPANEEAVEEVIVTGVKEAPKTEMSEDTSRLFSVAGASNDPLQAIFALPGVLPSSEGEPMIRGSGPSDNAFYIDAVPVSYIFHVFGNSIFNKEFIHSFDLYPGAYPSEYQNATGGVIDVKLRSPRNQDFTTTLAADFLQTSLSVESGITDDQAFYFSIRRSMIDILLKAWLEDEEVEDGVKSVQLPVATDYQLKYQWNINEEQLFSLLLTGADDRMKMDVDEDFEDVQQDPDLSGGFGLKNGFDSQGIYWQFDDQLDHSFSIRLTHLEDYLDLYYGKGQKVVYSANRYLSRFDYGHYWSEDNKTTTGISYFNHRYDVDVNAKVVPCSEFDPNCSTVDAVYSIYKDKLNIDEITWYAEHLYNYDNTHYLTLGISFTIDNYTDDERLEPRVSWAYWLFSDWVSTISMGKYSQLPELKHLVPVTGNPDLSVIRANHYVWSLENLLSNGWSWKTDIYYKQMRDVVVSDQTGKNYSNDAKGRAYGIEFVLNKNLTGKWYGWSSLALSRAERIKLKPYKRSRFEYDTPVVFNTVWNYNFTDNFMIGFKWQLKSGVKYTPIVSEQSSTVYPNVKVPIYGEYNSERYPYQHSLDLRAQYRKKLSWGYWQIHGDILNAYNQKNVMSYEYAPDGENVLSKNPDGFGPDIPVIKIVSFGMIPSVGFEMQF